MYIIYICIYVDEKVFSHNPFDLHVYYFPVYFSTTPCGFSLELGIYLYLGFIIITLPVSWYSWWTKRSFCGGSNSTILYYGCTIEILSLCWSALLLSVERQMAAYDCRIHIAKIAALCRYLPLWKLLGFLLYLALFDSCVDFITASFGRIKILPWNW